MILVLPREALRFQSFVAEFWTTFTIDVYLCTGLDKCALSWGSGIEGCEKSLDLFWVLAEEFLSQRLKTLLKSFFSGSLEFIGEGDDTFFGEDAIAVGLEKFVGLELDGDWAVHEDFLHHLLFGDFSPATSDVSGTENLGLRSALLELFASDTFSFSLIRGAFVGDQVSLLGEEAIEMWPSTLATFGQEVAAQNVLGREHWDLLTILDFESRFDGLVESLSVAGTTVTLVSDWVGEVVTIDVSEIILNRNFSVINIITLFVVLLILLNLLEYFLELLIAFGCELFGAGERDRIRILLGE